MTDTRYAPYVDAFDAIISWEQDGVETLDEAIAVAHAILDSGLVNSAGRYGRFVRDVANAIDNQEEAA